MKMDWLAIANIATATLLPILGVIIHKAVKTPNDAQRAVSMSKIAEGIAAIVVMQNPRQPWANLVQLVVNELKITSNDTTTSNIAIMNRVAVAALTAQGIKPPASDR